LLNLAFNSRDAMPGGGSITFETRTVSLNQESQVLIANELTVGNYVKVTVRDEGCGISPEIKHRIFEPFFTTKPQGQGMGMALASAYGIAKRQGGTITVDRGDGKGAAFHVYLAMGTDDESRPYSELTNGGITSKSSLNILLVDDEALILDLSSQILRMMGHVVTTASNGKEALDIYERDHQDIDLVMDGLAVFREMKRINQNVNLIVASGYAQEGRIQTAMDEGAFGFLPKPYTKDQLLDAIRKTKART
jgi:CheY-like chemotaxis protein